MIACCKLLVSESFVLASVHVCQAMMFLQMSEKTNVTLCSATFNLYMNRKELYL